MMLKPLILFALCALLRYSQAEIEIFIEDVVVDVLNTDYFDPEESTMIVNEKSDGQNTVSTDVQLLKAVSEDAEVRTYLLGYSKGDYKVSVGIDITGNLCEMIEDPIIMGPFLEVLGLTKDTCPPLPGRYQKSDYYPKMEMMPETFPNGKYQMIVELTDDEIMILRLLVFIEVE